MFHLGVLLAVITGTAALNDYWYALYGCHPPSSLRARAEIIIFDNDRNFDSSVTSKDLDINLVNYDKDGDTTRTYEWETVFHWRCRYGFHEDFVRYFYQMLDVNKDGVWTDEDYASPFFMTGENFRKRQIDLFRRYCEERNYRPTDCWKLKDEPNWDSFGNFSLPMDYYF